MLDLFEALGLSIEAPKKEEKKTEKKTVKKTSPAAKAGKSTPVATKPVSVTLPVTIYTGLEGAFILDKDVFDNKTSVTEKELREKIAEKLQVDTEHLALKKLDGTKVLLAGCKPDSFLKKGELAVSPGWKLKLGNKVWTPEVELSTVTTEQLNKIVSEMMVLLTSCEYSYSKKTNTISVVPALEKAETDDLKFPVRCFSFAHGKIEVTEEEYCKFAFKNREEDSEDEDDSDEVEEAELTVEGLIAFLAEKYPEYRRGSLQFNKQTGIVLATVEPFADEPLATSTGPAAPVEKLYPTENVMIKFGWARYPLNPELFGGKKEVKEEDLLQFLAEDYPEYSKDRTKFEYDAERGLIIPILSSGRKGAKLTLGEVEAKRMIESGNAIPFNYNEEGKNYFVINHPVALFAYDQGEETPNLFWKLNVPKIPFAVLSDILDLFHNVHEEFSCEVMVRIFYHPEKGYSIEVPPQTDFACHVIYEAFNQEEDDERILVAEIHSHNCFPAFWSSTDDQDEKGYRIYGVYGSFDAEVTERFRFGVGGKFFDILDITDIVGDPEEESSYESVDLMKAYMFE